MLEYNQSRTKKPHHTSLAHRQIRSMFCTERFWHTFSQPLSRWAKRITKEPRDYQKAGVTAIAAQQLFGSGVKLRPGQNIEYIITDSESSVPNDRVRAFALWEGWFGCDRKKYAAMLREAFEPFVQCTPKAVESKRLNDPFCEEELKRFPLFAALTLSRP